MFFDSTYLVLIPALLLSFYASYKVSSTFKKYSRVASYKGYTGKQVAIMLLQANGVNDVEVEHVRGELTDHYDPRSKKIRLSDSVYNSNSISAISVAAHETGHAIQHATSYMPLKLRSSLLPAYSFGTTLGPILIMLGIFLLAPSGDIGYFLLMLGILFYAVTVVFSIATLPVEFNASSRAIKIMQEQNIIDAGESSAAKKVLNAAALTYVAATISAILTLLRFILIANRNRD